MHGLYDDANEEREAAQSESNEESLALDGFEEGIVDSGPYCYCDGPDDGTKMLKCDGRDCPRVWFHYRCLGIDTEPEANEWYCDECERAMLEYSCASGLTGE